MFGAALERKWYNTPLREHRTAKIAERDAALVPVAELPPEYEVTPFNPKPPFLHFGIPVSFNHIRSFADLNDLGHYSASHEVTLRCLRNVLEALAEYITLDLHAVYPLGLTSDADLVIAMYTNYNMKKKKPDEEYKEKLYRLLRKAFGLDDSMQPMWFCDSYKSPKDKIVRDQKDQGDDAEEEDDKEEECEWMEEMTMFGCPRSELPYCLSYLHV